MTNPNRPSRSAVSRASLPGLECASLAHPDHAEINIVGRPQAGESVAELVRRVVDFCELHRAAVVSMTIFVSTDQLAVAPNGRPVFKSDLRFAWPVTWLRAEPQASGLIAYALTGVPVRPLMQDGVAVGSLYEIDGVRYGRLAGIVASDADAGPAAQAAAVFDRLERVLHDAGFRFQDVIRTWFFNADILSWYDGFNRVRNAFFRTRGIRGAAAPASTGIGIANHYGRALAAELLAVAGDPSVTRTVVPSPLQCPAVDYGSSFSRALELETASQRTLYVSGTASIAPDGRTEFVGDAAGQIRRTMEVVEALLASRGLGWDDTTRAIAFFKDISDLRHFLAYCERNGLGSFPVLPVSADVCRPELLFELELDAAAWK
jgi:enamine deaminase RidA (YjgF/YER057c/UK114 family)